MRAVVQRVSSARVTVEGEAVAGIGAGLCLLLGVGRGDTDEDARRLAGKVARLRIFEHEGRLDRSVLDTGGAVLAVSNFTLLADTAKGNRPNFSEAASPEAAEPVYRAFCEELRALGLLVESGVFGATMHVELEYVGPVTLVLDV